MLAAVAQRHSLEIALFYHLIKHTLNRYYVKVNEFSLRSVFRFMLDKLM